ncbi:MAG: isovaleryl-CoA dehydrogenase [Gammaproteobacteria bacterium]|nr:isovaleryl-CoA dehydrogenase [Gammaproteobacteria bacterium]MYF50805.1 isovaleryl-CoA dehydrogenase [Gammaproteobacteria bacterium]MYH14776.1 isovaleryl-CoA dehydrogenase [Gammaproteobacteria bacterium]MYK84181.1 isovaleryl-CoA dehydrogenase [Gammaproteobacteria bacterium]
MTIPDLARYGYAEAHQQIYDTVYRYSREQLHPLCDRMDRDDWFPEAQYRSLDEMGLLGTSVPEQYGGQGLGFIEQCLITEALSYWNASFGAAWMGSESVCLHNIVRNADDALKARYLPGFSDGSLIGALGLTEPGAGSDALGSMATRAVRDGDDFVINGRKMFISLGPVADIVLLYAKTAPEQGAKGVSAFAFETKTPGFEVAQHLDKMGWRGVPTAELVFNDCRVPAGNVIGGVNGGVGVVMSGLNMERVILCFHMIGVAQRALDITLDYANDRKQFGQPIGRFQLVQGLLADMYTDLQSMRAFSYQMAREVADLEIGGGGRGEAHMRTSAVMLHAGRSLMRIVDNGVQVHGGAGYILDLEINRLYRVGKLMEIGAGTNQIRQVIIAEELLK